MLKNAFWQAGRVCIFLLAGGAAADWFLPGVLPAWTFIGLVTGLALGVLGIGTAAEAAFKESPCSRYLVVAGGAFGYYFAVLGLVTGFFIEHAVVMACLNLYTTWPWVTIATGVVFGLVGGFWYARQVRSRSN
ncbi:hypothetical protein KJ596_03440 [Patescibacteria group bacterium]|nr:hypothetical protein [Patescibacteria group bacterium]